LNFNDAFQQQQHQQAKRLQLQLEQRMREQREHEQRAKQLQFLQEQQIREQIKQQRARSPAYYQPQQNPHFAPASSDSTATAIGVLVLVRAFKHRNAADMNP
jgi:hypothetical protein